MADTPRRGASSTEIETVPDQVNHNRRRALLLVAIAALLSAVVVAAPAAVVGLGWLSILPALLVAGVGAAVAWRASDRIVLAVSRAQPADPTRYARLHNLVEGLCVAGGLPKPEMYVVEDDAPNALVAGRSSQHAAILVTTGLLERLNRVELEAVLAHELGLIKNDDVLVDTLAVTCVAPMVLLADLCIRTRWSNGGRLGRDDDPAPTTGAKALPAHLGTALLALSPPVARLLRSTVSPRGGDPADVTAVAMTRYPPALVSALAKLRDDSTVTHAATRATAHLWLAAPLARDESEGHLAARNRTFATHPPLEERIAALQEL